MPDEKLIKVLKEDLKVKKEIIAVKVMKSAPPRTPHYAGQA